MIEIPSSIAEIQRWFASFITSPIKQSDDNQIPLFTPDAIPDIRNKIAPSGTLRAEERLGIYQQQYWWRLISVMQELFPTLVALFDYEEFNRQIAEPYLASHIPQDWFISNVGLNLPDWLQSCPINHEFPLSELAQIDLVFEQLLFIDILPPLDFTQCAEQKLYLQPFVLLFQMDVDLFNFRKQLIEKESPLPLLAKGKTLKHFVVYRLNETNYYEEVHSTLFKLLARFQKGAKLEEVASLLEKCDDVGLLFQTFASRNWLTTSSSTANNRPTKILVQTQKQSKKQIES